MANKHFELACRKLSPNNLESGLPGRETHIEELYNFLFERLKIRQSTASKKARVDIPDRHMNKTIFICGVPGTGKTVTVLDVVSKLKKAKGTLHQFEHIYVNAQHLSSPEKVYSEIFYQLSGETCQNTEKAQEQLDKMFASLPYKIIIVDELDLLYSERRQAVFYNLFDWPTSSASKMILIAIANAMDLPERFMRGRVASRLGWNKLVFESYSSDCLANILKKRLGKELLDKCFEKNAIIVATKRIGRTTGDARRVLDTCRLAINKAIEGRQPKVTAAIIDQVGFQNLDQQRRNYICKCPPIELMVLKCILKETARVGEENVEAMNVYRQLVEMSQKNFSKTYIVTRDKLQSVLYTLSGIGLIYLENDKPFFKKSMFIRDSSEVFRDLIRSQQINS